jgi:tetratricopeptide (TPR) repeat protein
MFPRLTLLQWFIVIFGLAFYGFAVFALTRDYYLRNPPRPAVAAQASAAANPHALGASMRDALSGADDDVSALIADIEDPAVLNDQADRLFQARRYRDAIALYRRVLELTPGSADAQNDLGLALHYAGDTEVGLETLRAAAAAAPEHQRLQLTFGFIALQAKDLSTATEALTRAQALDPDTDIGREAARLLGLMAEHSSTGDTE